MKMLRSHKAAGFVCLLVLSMLCAEVFAETVKPVKPTQPTRSRRGWGVYGDWDVKMDFNGTEFKSILSFSRGKEGKLVGHWISFWGMNELKDIKFENDKLIFVQTYPGRNGKSVTSKFAGTVKEGKISGTISSDRGDTKIEGKRSRRTPRAVGKWAIIVKTDEKDITSTLVISADKEGKLAADLQTERDTHKVTYVKYERGKLTLKNKGKTQDREWEWEFEGNVRGDTFNGVVKSEGKELKVEGKRIGTLAIGKWNLEIESERGNRKQRLQINPDMSGMYGSIAIKKVTLEGDKVSFKTTMSFGERKFDMNFEGNIKESKLTGELKTSRGTQKIKGTKIVRPTRRRRSR